MASSFNFSRVPPPYAAKQGFLRMRVMDEAFPFSLCADADGVGVGRLVAGGATTGGAKVIEGATFNFILAHLASGLEGAG